jgi:hypothetical protein
MKHVPKRLPIGVLPERDLPATVSGLSRDDGVTVAFTRACGPARRVIG